MQVNELHVVRTAEYPLFYTGRTSMYKWITIYNETMKKKEDA